ncbi:peptidoglycan editing factor PgeF [Sulfuricurvum sp.]|uniref:peptidoglycan editing factor PgeF n=1 Tax=Sulfuricurvum sp. TaxID=2025608 RepID=UPI002E37D883|nr:peptidoglycan editing factor PgeF [Sulfuricurvum sp.]HEX5328597.1 peptidoglycan editing factor PgeF [Sulfuricurvum sp.]
MKTVSLSLFTPFPSITAAFTSRHGGISKAPYTDANLAFHVGDNPEDVVTNHDLLADTLAYNRHSLIHMRQIHSDRIVIVDETLNFDTPPECDALITNRIETPLMVMSADCTGILIYDPIQKAIAAVHAGRAGALNAILPKTIQKMGEAFGSLRENLHIVLGPSIGGCCYEINETIASECTSKGYGLALRREDEKVFLDVNTILLKQLKELNIENVEVIKHCTSCRCDEYFSYRADAQQTGRIAGVIILR